MWSDRNFGVVGGSSVTLVLARPAQITAYSLSTAPRWPEQDPTCFTLEGSLVGCPEWSSLARIPHWP